MNVSCGHQVVRRHISREEVELQDVERQMEEELVQDYMQVDRIISVRSEPDGSLRYLCKVSQGRFCVVGCHDLGEMRPCMSVEMP